MAMNRDLGIPKELYMANFIYVACSIDGFIAKPDGDINWLNEIPNENNDDYGYEEFMRRVDGLIMGRKTFEKVLEFDLPEWPYKKPVFVLSTTLKRIPEKLNGKVEILRETNLRAILSGLKLRNIHNVYVDGGKTIQSFLKENLIDEMIVTTISMLLGNGIPLFGATNIETKFKLAKTERINEYMVKNHYIKTP
jgi:dihydrofolate reductase